MHGRLKVRTSAEEALRKKKEQDLKAKAYRIGMDKIIKMREVHQLDSSLLELTGKILSVNPDLTTLWNIRRECILQLTDKDTSDGTLFERDLRFTELCLQIQPKSYGAWHHRCWILENSPCPDWNLEVDLCTKYLKKDERNFHCWDYRRYVVGKAKISADKEFQFCDEKIMKNFSNYSSWHYRSQLLPILHPHETDKSRPISESKLKEELELVITAAFTDPNDSSAWFYQRWLLGYSDPQLDLACFKINNRQAIICFTKPVDLNKDGILINLNSIEQLDTSGKWKSIGGGKSDTIWVQEGNFAIGDSNAKVTISFNGSEKHLDGIKNENGSFIGIKLPKFGYEFGTSVRDELKNQLESCNQLLEYEPESKWTLLTAALLMRSIDRFAYHKNTLDFLKKLQKVDHLRAGYYKDLASKWTVEMKLKDWIKGGNLDLIDFTNLNLSTVYYNQYFAIASQINLEGNPQLNKNSCKFSLVKGCTVKY